MSCQLWKVMAGVLSLDGEVANEALTVEEAGGPLPRASRHSLAPSGARRIRPPDKLILGLYAKPLD